MNYQIIYLMDKNIILLIKYLFKIKTKIQNKSNY